MSVWLVKAEFLSWRSLCKAGNALLGTSPSKALRIGKHTVHEIFDKKYSSAGAVFQRHSWASAGKKEITIVGFEGTPRSPPTMTVSGTNLPRNKGAEQK